MRIEVTFEDEESTMKFVAGPDGITLYRPSNGLTPTLDAVAEEIAKSASNEEGRVNLLMHVRQASDMVVLFGKDMCG